MITKITGQLVALHGDTVTLKIDAFEYEVLIPEFTRRQLQGELGQPVSLHTIEYMEGNPMQGRMTPAADRLPERNRAGVLRPVLLGRRRRREEVSAGDGPAG